MCCVPPAATMPRTKFCARRLVWVVSKQHAGRLRIIRIEDSRLVIVEDDLELMDLVEILQAGDQLGFGGADRPTLIPVHAGGSVKDIDEFAADPLGTKHAGLGLVAPYTSSAGLPAPFCKVGCVGERVSQFGADGGDIRFGEERRSNRLAPLRCWAGPMRWTRTNLWAADVSLEVSSPSP